MTDVTELLERLDALRERATGKSNIHPDWLGYHRGCAEAVPQLRAALLEMRETLTARETELAELRKEADEEAWRWQDRIAETIRRARLDPFDASGNDSGDPLDWTEDQVDHALHDARDIALDSIRAYVKLFPFVVPVEAILGYCDALATEALAKGGGR